MFLIKINYKEIENPLDIAKNISKGTAMAAESVFKASVHTVKDVSYRIIDTFSKLKFW
ncbi:hypothetical protein [Candidatus Phytoplasma ziziphi]|uniref:hypothetical protein n=1 Tax=Candidatus Phytoplasma TaxID=33926 RepID=UPI00137518EF|nr:hypothetical protein [Candidatus Phytoplasma ziziphi]